MNFFLQPILAGDASKNAAMLGQRRRKGSSSAVEKLLVAARSVYDARSDSLVLLTPYDLVRPVRPPPGERTITPSTRRPWSWEAAASISSSR